MGEATFSFFNSVGEENSFSFPGKNILRRAGSIYESAWECTLIFRSLEMMVFFTRQEWVLRFAISYKFVIRMGYRSN